MTSSFLAFEYTFYVFEVSCVFPIVFKNIKEDFCLFPYSTFHNPYSP